MLYLEEITEAVRAKLVAASVCGGRVYKNVGEPTQDQALPLGDVFVAGDQASPDGDPRTGYPRFIHTAKLVIEITDKANDGAGLKAKLVQHAETVIGLLMTDIAWLGLGEGIGGLQQTYMQPPEGKHVIGAVQIQIDVLWRTHFQPDLTAASDFGTASVAAGNGVGVTITVPTE